MIESILGICSGAKTAWDTYKMASAIIKGDPQIKLLEEIAKQTGDMKVHIERLSDNILYAPNMQAIQDVNPSRRQQVEDLREVRETLDPLQRALGENIFSSAMILTPEKMRQAMVKDPWDVLDDIRPFNRATPHHDPAKIPILFDCKVFGKACTPTNPMGSCMVSSEGACAAYFKYGKLSLKGAIA